jgi:hypothetical protein
MGQPWYKEGETGAPDLEKDKHRDWSLRLALQNGWEEGVDSEGNHYIYVPGNLRIKVQGSIHISSRGPLTLIASKLRLVAMSVLRFIAPTIDQTNYPRPNERADLREMAIDADAFKGPPGRNDPGIGKVEDLE